MAGALNFHRISDNADELFGWAFKLYEISFPEHEQRLIKRQAALLENPLYHFEALTQAGQPAGLIAYWDFPQYTYIEHYAIAPELRGMSLGSLAISLFVQGRGLTILEIDPPLDTVSVRREGFYHRLGFKTNHFPHVHPAYRKHFQPHQLVIMSCPNELSELEYERFADNLKAQVMSDSP